MQKIQIRLIEGAHPGPAPEASPGHLVFIDDVIIGAIVANPAVPAHRRFLYIPMYDGMPLPCEVYEDSFCTSSLSSAIDHINDNILDIPKNDQRPALTTLPLQSPFPLPNGPLLPLLFRRREKDSFYLILNNETLLQPIGCFYEIPRYGALYRPVTSTASMPPCSVPELRSTINAKCLNG